MPLTSFADIRKLAEERKGGKAALEELLGKKKPLSVKQLAKIADDRYLSMMTRCVFQAGFTWKVVEHKWAGLRSFAPDRLPVYGFADGRPDFFWFAGQGGFGIQTAPAAALLAAALLLGSNLDPVIAAIDPDRYAPRRFG